MSESDYRQVPTYIYIIYKLEDGQWSSMVVQIKLNADAFSERMVHSSQSGGQPKTVPRDKPLGVSGVDSREGWSAAKFLPQKGLSRACQGLKAHERPAATEPHQVNQGSRKRGAAQIAICDCWKLHATVRDDIARKRPRNTRSRLWSLS